MYGWGGVGPVVAQGYAAAAQAMQDEEVLSITISTNRGMAPSMAEFFNNELLSDIIICSQDGESFKCHKLVLIRWSAPLRRMLTGDMREAHESSITLHGVDSDVLAAFLTFMYTCSCTIATEKLVALTALADQYDVTLLQQLCVDAIRHHCPNHRCCCLFYKAAKEVQQSEIQQLAWDHLASNLTSLVRQHNVFVQLELEDVLLLCGRPTAAPASTSNGTAVPNTSTTGASSRTVSTGSVLEPPRRQQMRSDNAGSYADAAPTPSTARLDYLLFLALMAWLDHKPERQQYQQQLLDCVDFDRMTNVELSQMRHHPHVESSNQLKDMLLDAYARRCLQTAQQPVYHLQPLSAAPPDEPRPQPAGAGVRIEQEWEQLAYPHHQGQQQLQRAGRPLRAVGVRPGLHAPEPQAAAEELPLLEGIVDGRPWRAVRRPGGWQEMPTD